VFGHRAVLAAIAARPGDLRRVLCTAAVRREAEAALRAAPARVQCEVLEDGALIRACGSPQAEGLCAFMAPRRFASAVDLADRLVSRGGVAIAFDRVRNPYNIGAILRTAAFFGLDGAVLGAPAPHPALPPDAVRVAEGGAEHLMLTRTTDLADTLTRFRSRGITVLGAESEDAEPALGRRYPRPVVLVVGHEREGVSERVRASCDGVVGLVGAGAVRSLNVAVAASILIAEVTRKT